MSPPDETSFLPAVDMGEKEEIVNWSQFETPSKFIEYLVQRIGIDLTTVDKIKSIQIGPDQPDFDTIWFNNEEAPFIGIPVNGAFHKIYQYPPNSPFVALNSSVLTNGVRQVTEAERVAWGLPPLNGVFWAILDISVPTTT